MSSDSNRSSGLGFASVLTLIFIVLKLVGVINWSWIWVLCPLWINFSLAIILLIIIAIMDNNFSNKRNKSKRIRW
jgi:low affinity Fe/Cu permease